MGEREGGKWSFIFPVYPFSFSMHRFLCVVFSVLSKPTGGDRSDWCGERDG